MLPSPDEAAKQASAGGVFEPVGAWAWGRGGAVALPTLRRTRAAAAAVRASGRSLTGAWRDAALGANGGGRAQGGREMAGRVAWLSREPGGEIGVGGDQMLHFCVVTRP